MLYLRLNDGEWRGIEAACGWTLSKTLRDDIIRVTQEFLTLENVQIDNVADVNVVLESYDKASSRFFRAIFADPSGQSAASIHAHDLIESSSRRSGKNEESLFDTMLTTLRAFHIACNIALKQLREIQTSSSRSDKAWRLWISWLTEIIEQAGLRSWVSKDLAAKATAMTDSPHSSGSYNAVCQRRSVVTLHRRKIARKPLLLPKEWQRGENK